MKKHLPSLLILLAGCLWGSMGLFVHTLNGVGITAMQMVEIRAIVTAIIMFIALGICKPSLLKVKLRHLWCFVGTGILSVVFFNFCYFSTIEKASMSVAAVLLYTSPIFVMLLSRLLFREAFTGKKWLALLLAFCGCLLVSGILSGKTQLSGIGFLTGIGAGFGYALYSIFSRYAIQYGYSGWTITAYTFLFAAIGGAFLTDFGQIVTALSTGCISLAAFFVFFAAITTLLPYITYTAGLQHTDNSKAAVLASIEPVVATLLGLIVYKEIPSLITFIGILLVLSAVVLLSVPPKQKT